MNALDAFQFFFLPYGRALSTFGSRVTKTQWNALKFGMFFNWPKGKRLVDWWPRKERSVFLWHHIGQRQPLTDQDCPRYRHWCAPPLWLPKLHPWLALDFGTPSCSRGPMNFDLVHQLAQGAPGSPKGASLTIDLGTSLALGANGSWYGAPSGSWASFHKPKLLKKWDWLPPKWSYELQNMASVTPASPTGVKYDASHV